MTATCDKIPLSEVNATLGVAATEAKPGDASDSISQSSTCDYYTATDCAATISRNCIKAGPAAAKAFYQNEHDSPLDGTQSLEEVSGLGDLAFIRYDDALVRHELIVLTGSLIVLVRSCNIADHATAKQKNTALMQKVLALP